MPLSDLIDLGGLFASWRLYVAIALTLLLCWPILVFVPDATLAWILCAPLGLAGFVLGFVWQIRADRRDLDSRR